MTEPRWKTLGLPEDAGPINAYAFVNGDRRASDIPDTPEHPGPSLAAIGTDGAVKDKPPRHHATFAVPEKSV